MDNRDGPKESIIVSVPSSRGHTEGDERQDLVTPSTIKKAWRCLKKILSRIRINLYHCSNYFDGCYPMEIFVRGLVYLFFYTFFVVGYKWKRVFILSCVAISIDCLFLYIPIIDRQNNCLDSDKTLRNVALILRSLTDITFICHIILVIADAMDEGPKWDDSNQDSKNNTKAASRLALKIINPVHEAIAAKMPEWLSISIIVNFLALLPVPQVTIVVGYYKIGGSHHFFKHAIINVFIVFQCLLRVLQIFLSNKKIDEKVGKWVKCSFYFLLYIIASNVLAAFWYFFSIQREVSCWDQACRKITGCTSLYYCNRKASSNTTSLNKLCPIESPNATIFDFGMFLDILKSGNIGYTTFSRKFFYCLWWSLKNLSNFGTNLNTSSNVWENCFAIIICIIGLLLFLFLIGNVQTYIQSETAEFMKIEESRRTKITKKYKDIEKWMSIHRIPDDMKIDIISNLKEAWIVKFVDKEVNTEFMCRCYDRKLVQTDPMVFVCVNALKEIPLLEDMDDTDLKRAFCGRFLKFITKEKDSYIARVGEDLDTMYLIIDDIIECNDAEATTTETTRLRYKYHGEQLLYWALSNCSKEHRDPLPISEVDVKCETKIGAFEFTADVLIESVKNLNSLEQLREKAARPRPRSIKIGEPSPKTTIEEWMSIHHLPNDMEIDLLDNIKRGMEDAKVDTESMQSCYWRYSVKLDPLTFICVNALKNVPILGNMDQQHLKVFCEYEFRSFPTCITQEKGSYISRAGEELKAMWLIIDGVVECIGAETSTGSPEMSTPTNSKRRRYGYVGEEVLRWAVLNYKKGYFDRDPLPLSTLDVKCRTKVGGFMFTGDELIKILMEFKNPEQLESLALSHDSKTDRRIKDWLLGNGFPEDLKAKIMSCPYNLVVEDNMYPDVDVKFLFDILPEYINPSIKRHLGMNALKRVPMLQHMPEYVLEAICHHLEPAVYKENSYVVGAREPLDFMIFILRGTITVTDTTSSNAIATGSYSEITESSSDEKNHRILTEGDFYGEQLLSWALPKKISYSDHPISTQSLKCETKVEALTLKAEDLKSALFKCGSRLNFNNSMNSQGDKGDNVIHTSASAPSNVEQTIQLHQGHDMLLEQLILIRDTMFRRFDDQERKLDNQGRRLDEMAVFLARVGYTGITSTSSTPPGP